MFQQEMFLKLKGVIMNIKKRGKFLNILPFQMSHEQRHFCKQNFKVICF